MSSSLQTSDLVWRCIAVVLVSAAGFAIWHSIIAAIGESGDLREITDIAKTFMRGEDPYHLWIQHEKGLGPYPGYAPNYTPSAFVLIMPLALIDFTTLKPLFAVFNLALAALTMVLLQRRYLPQAKWPVTAILVSLLLTSTPLRNHIYHGQVAIFALAMFVLSLETFDKGKRGLTIFLLVLAFFKYTLTFPWALIFLRRKDGPLIVGSAVAAHVLLTLGAAAWIGENPITLLSNQLHVNEAWKYLGWMNYSNILWTFGDTGGNIGIGLSMIIALASFALVIVRPAKDELLSLTFLSVVSSLAIYHGGYDMVLYAFPVLYVVRPFLEKSFSTTPRIEKAAILLVGLTAFLLWFGIEFVETTMKDLMVGNIGDHAFAGEHVVEVWYLLMFSATASLVLLYKRVLHPPAGTR